jgi:hypothetical protein
MQVKAFWLLPACSNSKVVWFGMHTQIYAQCIYRLYITAPPRLYTILPLLLSSKILHPLTTTQHSANILLSVITQLSLVTVYHIKPSWAHVLNTITAHQCGSLFKQIDLSLLSDYNQWQSPAAHPPSHLTEVRIGLLSNLGRIPLPHLHIRHIKTNIPM